MSTPTRIKRTFRIVSGPNTDRIWDSAKYRCDAHANVETSFTGYWEDLGSGNIEQIVVEVGGVQHEDGSGDSLILKGNIGSDYFEGYFKGRNRRGWFNINTLA